MRRTPLLVLLVLVPVLSLLAACGTSGGDDSAGSDAKSTTTVAADGDDDDGADAATLTALTEILPTADEIASGYKMSSEDLDDEPEESDDESDEPDPMQEAISEACPGASALEELDDGEDNPDEVSREFENSAEGGITIEVALDPTPGKFTEDTINTIVEALADCGTITTEDEDGGTITMTLDAEKTDEFGDFGLQMTMSATFDLMGTEIPIEFHGLIFNVDGTTVSVVASSGLDEATFEAVPGDYDLLPDLASMMEERVAAL